MTAGGIAFPVAGGLPRLLIVGVDSGDHALVAQWMADGELPNFARVAEAGTFGPLRSTIPPLTPVAWNTLMTGVNAGMHGVFDWRDVATSEGRATAGALRGARTIWQILSDRGHRVGAFNVPATFPPDEVRGFMVAGLDSPGFVETMAHPREAFGVLREAVGEYDPFPRSIQSEGSDLAEVARQVEVCTLGPATLARRWPVEALMTCYCVTDWVSHAFLCDRRLVAPDGSVVEDMVLHTYRLVDQALGRWLDAWVGPETTVIVLSDHGARLARKLVNLDRLFVERGWLRYKTRRDVPESARERREATARLALQLWQLAKRALPHALVDRLRARARAIRDALAEDVSAREIDWDGTVAYPVSGAVSGYVRICAQGEAAHRVKAEVKQSLADLRDPETGQPVFEQVLEATELFSGPLVLHAPEIVLVPRDWDYVMPSPRAKLGRYPLLELEQSIVRRLEKPWGIHAMDGILLASGPDVRRGAQLDAACLADIAPTLLYLMQEAIPAYMEGRVLEELFDERILAARPPARVDEAPLPDRAETSVYTAEEQARLEERLADLGYL